MNPDDGPAQNEKTIGKKMCEQTSIQNTARRNVLTWRQRREDYDYDMGTRTSKHWATEKQNGTTAMGHTRTRGNLKIFGCPRSARARVRLPCTQTRGSWSPSSGPYPNHVRKTIWQRLPNDRLAVDSTKEYYISIIFCYEMKNDIRSDIRSYTYSSSTLEKIIIFKWLQLFETI